MICKYCGCEFEQSKKGRARTYCYRRECVNKAHNESNRKYLRKIKREQKKLELKHAKEDNIVYTEEDRTEHKLSMPDTGDILELARQLGALRYQLVQKIQKEYEIVGKYDKLDQDFLHKLENLDELSNEDAIKLVVQEKKNRESRRVYKVRYYLIKCLLDSMPIKNPSSFIAQAIQRSKDYQYIPRVIEELKSDEAFYTKKESD